MKVSNINKQIGGRIRIARISRNLSQDNIAEDLGISVSAYSNMERGVVDITIKRILQVSEILKLKWHYLLGITSETEMSFEQSLQLLAEPTNKYQQSKPKPGIDLEKEIRLLKGELGKLKKKGNIKRDG